MGRGLDPHRASPRRTGGPASNSGVGAARAAGRRAVVPGGAPVEAAAASRAARRIAGPPSTGRHGGRGHRDTPAEWRPASRRAGACPDGRCVGDVSGGGGLLRGIPGRAGRTRPLRRRAGPPVGCRICARGNAPSRRGLRGGGVRRRRPAGRGPAVCAGRPGRGRGILPDRPPAAGGPASADGRCALCGRPAAAR